MDENIEKQDLSVNGGEGHSTELSAELPAEDTTKKGIKSLARATALAVAAMVVAMLNVSLCGGHSSDYWHQPGMGDMIIIVLPLVGGSGCLGIASMVLSSKYFKTKLRWWAIINIIVSALSIVVALASWPFF